MIRSITQLKDEAELDRLLEGLTRRSQTDAYAVLKIARTGQQEELLS